MKSTFLALGLAAFLAHTSTGAENASPTVAANAQILVERDSPRTITYSELRQLSGATDSDGDVLLLEIVDMVMGSLDKNGQRMQIGDDIAPGESLIWTPPALEYGTYISAFKVAAFDGTSYSASSTTVRAAIQTNTAPILSSIDAFSKDQFRHALMNTPYTIRYEDLLQASDLIDADGDALLFAVNSVPSGTLKVDGGTVVSGRMIIGPGCTLRWTSGSNQTGLKIQAFSIFGYDGKTTSQMAVPVLIDVIDPTPRFTKGRDISVGRDSIDTIFWDWARNILPEDGAWQFEVTHDNPGLFMYDPEITSDGTLMFSLDGIQYGTANVTAVLVDDQGRRSAPATFKIDVKFVNYPPYFTIKSGVVLPESLAGMNTVIGFVDYVDPGAPNETDIVKFQVVAENPALFATRPAISPAGTLTYRLAPTATGSAKVRVVANDGRARSLERTFVIQIPQSPFPTLKGTYAGLFHGTEEVRHDSSGILNVNVTDRGAFSGKITLGATVVPFSGAFTTNFKAAVSVKPRTGSALSIQLNLREGEMDGTVSAAEWVSELRADQTVLSAKPVSYTLVVNKGTGPLTGKGVFTFNVASNGQVTVSGTLADGAKVSQRTFATQKRQFPLYGSLYNGGGSIIGWLSLVPTKVGGAVVWSKGVTNLLSGPFVSEASAVGSVFTPRLDQPVLPVGRRPMVISGGNLPNAQSIPVMVGTSTITADKLKISINAKTGLASGSFMHPVSGLPAKVRAVVLQDANNLQGCFVEPATVGEISGLQP